MGDIVDMRPGQETGLLAFARYQDLERAADRTAVKIKEGFMEMGYILKVARDTDILAGSGYAGHEEFAEKRYGLDKGTVSRYIRIVERFSVGGNSHVLQDGYRNIGFAKLSLMLHMPDAIAEEITEGYSKQEVQAIKEEVDAERAVSDIEVAIEDAGMSEEERSASALERAIRQLGMDRPQVYRGLHRACSCSGNAARAVMEALAPEGDAIFMVRLPGMGRMMLAINGESASVTSVRSGDKERYSAEDILTAAMGIMHGSSVEASWQQEYGEPMEPARETAQEPAAEGQGGKAVPARQKEKRKASKVVKAAPPKAAAKERTGPEGGAVVPVGAVEEQLPGQMEVTDYPEAIPDVHYEEIQEMAADDGSRLAEGPVMAAAVETDGGLSGCDGAVPVSVSRQRGVDGRDGQEPGTGMDSVEDASEVRMEAERHLENLRKYFAVWERMPMEYLEKAHQEAICLAAGIERMMDMEVDADGKEYHAQ